jgi:hypothetical protein
MTRRNRNQVDLPRIDIPVFKKVTEKLPKPKMEGLRIAARQLLVVAGVVALVLIMLNLNSRLSEYYRLSAERDTLSTRVAGLDSTRQVLETQLAYAQSDLAAEDYARSAHMVRQGEKLVVPLAPVGNPTPTPVSVVATVSPPLNWEVWWALFFEK